MKLNALKYIFPLLLLAMLFVACDDTVTYSEMKEKEREVVAEFIKEKGIKVIKYKQFIEQDSVTDVSRNEFVEIDGVYMQIINNPKEAKDARKINDGDSPNMLVRYYEYNISEGDTISWNEDQPDADEMRVENHSGTFSATFTSGVMCQIYNTAVPTGWLVPFSYLYFTRDTSDLAEVMLIVPHTKGTANAATYVYPCLYKISFQPEPSHNYDKGDDVESNDVAADIE